MGAWNTLAGLIGFGRPAASPPLHVEPKASPAAIEKTATKAFGVAGGIRSALQGRNAGGWASDHRAETLKDTGWNYIAVHAIASAAAQAEVLVFDDSQDQNTAKRQFRRKSLRRTFGSLGRYKSLYGGDDRETDPLPADDPLVRLMSRPNPEQSGAIFRYELAKQIRLTGSGYIWNVPNRLGRVCERYVIPTCCMTAVAPTREMPRGGWRVDPSVTRYAMPAIDGFVENTGWMRAIGGTLPAEEVQIFRLPHALYKDDGQSPISASALWADTSDKIDQARFHHLNNGPTLSVVVTAGEATDPSAEDLEAAAETWNKKYSGVVNSGKAMFAAPGTTVTPISTTAVEMAYDLGFEQMKGASLAVHQVPPVAAGIQEAGAYAAYLASMRQFTATAVQPLLDMIAEEDNRVIAPQFGSGRVIEIEAKSFDDPEQIEKELTNDLNARARTKNEWRAVRGLPPVSAEQGGEDWVGQNPAPAVGMYPSSPAGINWPKPPATPESDLEPEAEDDEPPVPQPPTLPKRRLIRPASKTLHAIWSEYP